MVQTTFIKAKTLNLQSSSQILKHLCDCSLSNVDLGLQSFPCSKIRSAQHWGRRGAHLSENKVVNSECKKSRENSRQMAPISTICDEYCRSSYDPGCSHWFVALVWPLRQVFFFIQLYVTRASVSWTCAFITNCSKSVSRVKLKLWEGSISSLH